MQQDQDIDKLRLENARLKAQVATAIDLINAAVIDIMTTDQIGQWRGVGTFLIQDTEDYLCDDDKAP